MSLTPEQYLTVCAAAQLGSVAPALEGSYEGGTAGTIGALLLMAVQDIAARPGREAAEYERLRAIFDQAEASGYAVPATGQLPPLREALETLHVSAEERGDRALCGAILDHLVQTAAAARLEMPALE